MTCRREVHAECTQGLRSIFLGMKIAILNSCKNFRSCNQKILLSQDFHPPLVPKNYKFWIQVERVRASDVPHWWAGFSARAGGRDARPAPWYGPARWPTRCPQSAMLPYGLLASRRPHCKSPCLWNTPMTTMPHIEGFSRHVSCNIKF